MPSSAKYVPTHRAPGKHKAVRGPRRVLRTTVALTGLAAAVTGVSVTGGMFSSQTALTPAAADVVTTAPQAAVDDGPTLGAADLERREQSPVASRSARRTDATKAMALSMSAGSAVTKSQKLSEGDPRDIARALLPLYGFSSDQFSCCLLYTSPSPRDKRQSRMPSSA